MGIYWRALCPERKEQFQPDNFKDAGMAASALQLTELLMGDWHGCEVTMWNDNHDGYYGPGWDGGGEIEWPNRWRPNWQTERFSHLRPAPASPSTR